MNAEYKERLRTHRVVIFDFDSTLVTIEGIDELARFRNKADLIEPLTLQAMNGEISLEEAFIRRLDIIQPTHDDLHRLGHLYADNITTGAKDVIHRLQKNNTDVFVVSGGYNPAVSMVTRLLGIPDTHVFANELTFDIHGNYLELNQHIPLWRSNGKELVIEQLQKKYPGHYSMVGDGMSDKTAGKLTNKFICFAGVAGRSKVMEGSEVIYDLWELVR